MFMKRHTAEHNFIIDEVISALQKSIRRKQKEDAIYWALQLHNCGYGNAVFKRLTIILSEDIGVAESTLPICYANAYANWKKIVGKKVTDCTKYPQARDILIKVVALFSDANKTRIVNNATALFSTVNNPNGAYNAVASDDLASKKFLDSLMAVDRGNSELIQVFEQLIASIEEKNEEKALYWLTNIYERVPKKKEEKTNIDLKCKNKEGVFYYYWSILKYFAKRLKKEQKEIQNIIETINTLMNIYNENNDQKLPVFHALVLVVRLHANNEYLSDKFGSVVKLPNLEKKELDQHYKTSIEVKKDVPDYAVDKHTSRGKNMKRGLEHFFTHGAYVVDPPFEDLYMQRAQAAYYKIEKELGVKAAKSTQIRKRKRNAFENEENSDDTSDSNSKDSNNNNKSDNSDEKNLSEEMDVTPPKKKRKLNNNNNNNDMDIEDIKEDKKKNKELLFAKQMKLKKFEMDPEKEKKFKILKFDGSIIHNDDDDKTIYNENEVLYNGIYAQLPAGGKPTTFLATLKLPEFQAVEVFVKGPCLNPDYNIGQCMIDEAKKLFGLNSVGTHRILLKPDSNYHRVTTCYDFLLMRDVGTGASKGYPSYENNGYTVMDKSKLNTPDLVQYFKNVKNNKLDIKKDKSLLEQYARILAFRALFETSDANNHNFLIDITENRLYSIDENVVFKGFMDGKMYSHYPVKSIGESVAKFCAEDKYFSEMLDEWKNIVEGDEIHELLLKFNYNESHVQKLKNNLNALITMNKAKKLSFYRK